VSLIGGIGLATPHDADSRAGAIIAFGDPFIYRKGIRLLGPDDGRKPVDISIQRGNSYQSESNLLALGAVVGDLMATLGAKLFGTELAAIVTPGGGFAANDHQACVPLGLLLDGKA